MEDIIPSETQKPAYLDEYYILRSQKTMLESFIERLAGDSVPPAFSETTQSVIRRLQTLTNCTYA
jgi:hypothetical protein